MINMYDIGPLRFLTCIHRDALLAPADGGVKAGAFG
jgi:hypothetical protein